MNILTELESLIDAFERDGIDYALCGGMAVSLHGYTRFTRDIDLLIQLRDLPAAMNTAKTTGFEFPAMPMTFNTGTPRETNIQRVTKVEGRDHLELDLIVVTPILEDVWNRRESFKVNGRTVRTVSKDGLATMKRLANRDQDRLDLIMLGYTDGGMP